MLTIEELKELPLGSTIKQPEPIHNQSLYTKEEDGWRKSKDGRLVTSERISRFSFELVTRKVEVNNHLCALVQSLIDSAEQEENLERVSVNSKALLALAEALEIDTFHFMAK